MARELSGVAWVGRFPTSKSTDTLIDGFRQKKTIGSLPRTGLNHELWGGGRDLWRAQAAVGPAALVKHWTLVRRI